MTSRISLFINNQLRNYFFRNNSQPAISSLLFIRQYYYSFRDIIVYHEYNIKKYFDLQILLLSIFILVLHWMAVLESFDSWCIKTKSNSSFMIRQFMTTISNSCDKNYGRYKFLYYASWSRFLICRQIFFDLRFPRSLTYGLCQKFGFHLGWAVFCKTSINTPARFFKRNIFFYLPTLKHFYLPIIS